MTASRWPQLGITGLGLAVMVYVWSGHWADASPVVWLTSCLALAAGVLGAALNPGRQARGHLTVAVLTLVCTAAFDGLHALGRWPFAWDAIGDRRFAAAIGVLTLLTAVGLTRWALWARWFAMALAAAAAFGGVMNTLGQLALRDEATWLSALSAIAGGTIWAQLALGCVKARFVNPNKHALWMSRAPLIRTARWAANASLCAAPMLVLYAWSQPVVPQTVTSALVLAPVLAAGGLLVVARRVVGLLLLAAAGIALLVQTGFTLSGASTSPEFNDLRIAGYYAAFWLPAALLGPIAGVGWLRRRPA